MKVYHGCTGVFLLLFLCACRPSAPVTSFITIDLNKSVLPVNRYLYGLTLDDANHAIEGGLYAEQIRNRSFEEGVTPAGCLYDATGNFLITPAGWKVPFVTPDEIPGWHLLNDRTFWYLNTTQPVDAQNSRSLGVRVDYSGKGGGVVAEGFRGIGLHKGKRYELSFYLRGGNYARLSVGLRDSAALNFASDICQVRPLYEWTRISHTFTATENSPNATLVFSADSGLWFYLDRVSLFPEKTWKDRPGGLRADLVEALAALHPGFIRFPGGAGVEGYSIESAPKWEESIGPAEARKPYWSIWGYGSTNGVGFHEYLQLCEDLEAQPLYVTNAGILNQRYRLRYEEINSMEAWAKRLKHAIAYANDPTDSIFGRMRASHGHAQPFNLQTVELGNENGGIIYSHRYQYLRQAIKDAFPDMSVISNDTVAMKMFRGDWTDIHYLANAECLISSHDRFDIESISIRTPMTFIGEFGASWSPEGGSLRAAIGEAAFLVGAERNPMNVKGVAYSPLLGHAGFPLQGVPAITFDASGLVKSPSWHVLELFANHRGDEVLATSVKTFHKPLVTQGRVSMICYDDGYEVGEAALDGHPLPVKWTKDERTAIRFPAAAPAQPVPNRLLAPDPEATALPETPTEKIERRHLIFGRSTSGLQPLSEDEQRYFMIAGDSTVYNYEFTARVRRRQAKGKIRVQVRDNGRVEEQRDCISLIIANGMAGLYHCSGKVERLLAPSVATNMGEGRWQMLKIVCENEKIDCYLEDVLLTGATVPSSPSLVTVATRELATNTILLKVVNTTHHEEWASLAIEGGNMEGDVEMIRLTGPANGRNTLSQPDAIKPEREKIHFSFRRPITCVFPANSVTILRLKEK